MQVSQRVFKMNKISTAQPEPLWIHLISYYRDALFRTGDTRTTKNGTGDKTFGLSTIMQTQRLFLLKISEKGVCDKWSHTKPLVQRVILVASFRACWIITHILRENKLCCLNEARYQQFSFLYLSEPHSYPVKVAAKEERSICCTLIYSRL